MDVGGVSMRLQQHNSTDETISLHDSEGGHSTHASTASDGARAMDELDSKVQDLTNDLATYRKTNRSLKEELQEKDQVVAAAWHDNEKLRHQVQQLTQAWERSQAEMAALQAETTTGRAHDQTHEVQQVLEKEAAARHRLKQISSGSCRNVT